MSPNSLLRRRWHPQQRGGYDSDVEALDRDSEVLPQLGGAEEREEVRALEDGRVVEDWLIGQEVFDSDTLELQASDELDVSPCGSNH